MASPAVHAQLHERATNAHVPLPPSLSRFAPFMFYSNKDIPALCVPRLDDAPAVCSKESMRHCRKATGTVDG
jgi:hypothetical protein